jgi:transposase
MPVKDVRPCSKGQKNKFNDAEAIAEAVQRPTMKFVPTALMHQQQRALRWLFQLTQLTGFVDRCVKR